MERFKNGDRICFIGDSITAQNRYVALIVDHYKTFFPNEDIKIFNCGVSGGSASSMMRYFDEDVAPHKPNKIYIMLGVNDSCCGKLLEKRSPERYQALKGYYDRYRENLIKLCEMSFKLGAAVTLVTPPPYAEYQNAETEACRGGFALLSAYAESVKSICRELSLDVIDVNSFMAEKMQGEDLYIYDRIHPNDAGHYNIAKCILGAHGLDIGEFRPFPEYLEKWRMEVLNYRWIYAAELWVVKDKNASIEENVEYLKEYLENKRYLQTERTDSLNEYYKNIALSYVNNKSRQREMFFEIDRMYDEAKSDRI